MASRLDPWGVVGLAGQAVRNGLQVAAWSERQARAVLRAVGRSENTPPDVSRVPASETLDAKLERLLDPLAEEGSRSARQALFHTILDQLVPDEARILGALSDGSATPLVHVYRHAESGLVDEVVLENMALVGRTANLSLPQLTPTYVGHLLALGLLETGPEDPAMPDQYDTLEADTSVRRAMAKAGDSPAPLTIERRTLRLSGLGLELWAAAQGSQS
jgi:hypothetical protein